ncbi:MAG: hypothetical protein J7L61_04840 [Thermoplasmata archaeon]|nr:hypothetical protein [Thermoplasmata archaeon]
MAAISQLGNEQRILLLLHCHPFEEDTYEHPFHVCQEGMGEALSIRVSNLSKILSRMADEGMVSSVLGRVPGARRRRRVFFLTEKGMEAAASLVESLRGERVKVVWGEDGEGRRVEEMPFGEAIDRVASMGIPRWVLVELHRRFGVLDMTKARDILEGGPVRFVSEMPDPLGFCGRKKELSLMEEVFGSGSAGNIVHITGMPGIGKSYLAAEALRRFAGKRPVFWHRIKVWEEPEDLLLEVERFSRELSGKRDTVGSRSPPPKRRLKTALESLGGAGAILVLDDVHETPDNESGGAGEWMPFFRIMVDARKTGGYLLVLVSRTGLRWLSRETDRGEVVRIRLGGMDMEAAEEFIKAKNPGAAELWREIYESTAGHPLLMEISAEMGRPLSGEDISSFFRRELFSLIPPKAVEVVKMLSVFNLPVPAEALGLSMSSEDLGMLDDMISSGLISSTGEDYVIHDLVREGVLSLLSPEEAKILHRKAGDYLAGVVGGEEYPDISVLRECIMHFLASDSPMRAVEVFLSADRMLSSLPEREAEAMFGRLEEAAASEETRGKGLLPRLYVAEGDYWRGRGKLERALDRYTAAAVYASRQSGNGLAEEMRVVEEEARERIGVVQRDLNMWKETISTFASALEKAISTGDVRMEARERLNLATAYRSRGDMERALEYASAALEKFRKVGDPRGEAAALHEMGVISFLRGGDDGLFVGFLERSISLSRELGDHEAERAAAFTLIRLLTQIGEIDRAVSAFSQVYGDLASSSHDVALSFASQVLDTMLPQDLSGAEAVFDRVSPGVEAFYDFSDSARIRPSRVQRMRHPSHPSPPVVAMWLGSAASFLREKGRPTNALSLRKKAADILERAGDRTALARLKIEMALDLRAAGDMERSFSEAMDAAEMLKAGGDVRGALAGMYTAGRSLLLSGRYRDAEKLAEEIIEIAEREGWHDAEEAAAGLKKEAARRGGRKDQRVTGREIVS